MQTSADIPASDAASPREIHGDGGIDADGRQDGASIPRAGRSLSVQDNVPDGSEMA
jgi:hypothetical protein